MSPPENPPPPPTGANRQWGGRFATAPSAIMRQINASVAFDQTLWRQDIAGSRAHAAMLAHVGIIAAADESAIATGLAAIAAEIEAGVFPWDEALEDVHMNIEARLADRIGDAGRRLHTARSRNDQVATDFRLWVRDAIDALHAQITDLMRALATRAQRIRRRAPARLHPSANRAAGHLRPPSAGLCRNAGARPRPSRRLQAPPQ